MFQVFHEKNFTENPLCTLGAVRYVAKSGIAQIRLSASKYKGGGGIALLGGGANFP